MNRLPIIVVLCALVSLSGQRALAQSGHDLFQKALVKERTEGNLDEAIRLYQQIVQDFAGDRPLAAKALVQMGLCYEKLGRAEARKAYERVLREYADQPEAVSAARVRLTTLGRQQADQGPVLRRVWQGKGVNLDGSVSPDGRYFAYGKSPSGNLVLCEVTTGTKHLVTEYRSRQEWAGTAMQPRFSPDGRRLAYLWLTKDGRWELRIIGTGGGEPRVIFQHENYVCPRAWSPDGKQFLATYQPETGAARQTALISVSDGSFRNLEGLGPGAGGAMRFSPDGRYIAHNKRGDIFLFAIDGRGSVPLVEQSGDDSVLGWSPDGQWLVFASDHSGTRDAWIIRVVDGRPHGSPQLAKKDLANGSPAGFTPAGSFYYLVGIDHYAVQIAEVDMETGKLLAPVTTGSELAPRSNSQPVWSPDGRSLAYLSVRRRAREVGAKVLMIRSLETGQERELVPKLIAFRCPCWTADGRFIVVMGLEDEKRQPGFYQVDVQTGVTTHIDPDVGMPAWSTIPAWSPDGKKIYVTRKFGSPQEPDLGIVVRDIKSGEEKAIVRADVLDFALSPDGQQLAVLLSQEPNEPAKPDVASPTRVQAVKVMPATGGAARELIRGEDIARRAGALTWTPDGRYLIFEKRTERPKPRELWRIPTAGGSPKKLELTLDEDIKPFHMGRLRIHPDGRQIAFTTREHQDELWVMENFLPKPGKPSGMVVRRVWARAADLRFTGAPSPDGKYLSLVDRRTGDLAVRELASGKNRRLTNEGWDKGFAHNSVFSPDSRQVAYYWWDNKEGNQLRIIGVDGSGARVVANHLIKPDDTVHGPPSGWIYSPAGWSADGEHILAWAVDTTKKQTRIVLVAVDGGSVRSLKTLHGNISEISLSPDGRFVAYSFPVGDDSPNRDISIVATDGSGETVLVEHPADDGFVDWAPDGKRVVFASDRTGSMGVWAIEVADGKPRGTPQLLKPEIGQFHPLGFAKNGSYYYGVVSGGSNVYVATYDPQKGNVTGKPVLTVKHYEGSNAAPDWSPDGRYLACLSRRPGVGLVFLIHSVETGEVRELSPDLKDFNVHLLRWSADGRSLLGAVKGRDGGLLKIDVETGEVTIIVEGRGFLYPKLSADGKAVFYVSRATAGWRILRRDLTTNEEKELFRAAVGRPGVTVGAILGLALSPDGKQLAFQDLDAGMLKVLSVAGGQPRELVKFKGKATIAWAPDGSHLLYANWLGTIRPGGLWRISAGGGKPQRLDLEMRYVNHVRFHPDGRRITFTAGAKGKSEVWAIENFLPESTAGE